MQISRSEKKRRVKDVEKLVAELSNLPSHLFDHLPLTDDFKSLLFEAQNLTGSNKNRYIKYLTRLIQEQPIEDLYVFLSTHRGKSLIERKQFRDLEYFRDALINEAIEQKRICRECHEDWTERWESKTLLDLKEQLPDIDPLALSRLSYLFVQTRNQRYSREIFRHLRAAQDLLQRKRKAASFK